MGGREIRLSVGNREEGEGVMTDRKYLPTLAELIDRLSIVQLKEIYIAEHAEEYRTERALIEHDIDVALCERGKIDVACGDTSDRLWAADIRAIIVLAIANRVIWENEAKARAGDPTSAELLRFTHSINGVRNTAKNVIAQRAGDRQDYKLDALAADLPLELGNWAVFR